MKKKKLKKLLREEKEKVRFLVQENDELREIIECLRIQFEKKEHF